MEDLNEKIEDLDEIIKSDTFMRKIFERKTKKFHIEIREKEKMIKELNTKAEEIRAESNRWERELSKTKVFNHTLSQKNSKMWSDLKANFERKLIQDKAALDRMANLYDKDNQEECEL